MNLLTYNPGILDEMRVTPGPSYPKWFNYGGARVSFIGPHLEEGDSPPEEAVIYSDYFYEVLFVEEDGNARISESIRIHDCLQEDYETMTLLIPDRDRPNQDDFIWCVPIERVKWNKWYALSEKFKTIVPPEHGGGVRYMNRMEGREVKTILMMPNESQTDEDAEHACAFLRMVKNMSCRMYIVRCTDDPLTGARLINKCVGADVTMVEEADFEAPSEEKPEE